MKAVLIDTPSLEEAIRAVSIEKNILRIGVFLTGEHRRHLPLEPYCRGNHYFDAEVDIFSWINRTERTYQIQGMLLPTGGLRCKVFFMYYYGASWQSQELFIGERVVNTHCKEVPST